jgi:hypothetical protein
MFAKNDTGKREGKEEERVRSISKPRACYLGWYDIPQERLNSVFYYCLIPFFI